jgi:TonB family protein
VGEARSNVRPGIGASQGAVKVAGVWRQDAEGRGVPGDRRPFSGIEFRATRRGAKNLKPFYAVAVLAVMSGTNVVRAIADDAPAASSPSCEFDESHNMKALSPVQNAANRARFMELCVQSNGTLINGINPLLAHNLTMPTNIVGRGPQEFYPPVAQMQGKQGTIWLAYVVETDGRITSPAVIKSSGNSLLDDAALKFIRNITYKSPAYVDFMPVRLYSAMSVVFKIG